MIYTRSHSNNKSYSIRNDNNKSCRLDQKGLDKSVVKSLAFNENQEDNFNFVDVNLDLDLDFYGDTDKYNDKDKDIHTNYSNTKIDFDQLLTSNKKQNKN